jgi:hypothetical protein
MEGAILEASKGCRNDPAQLTPIKPRAPSSADHKTVSHRCASDRAVNLVRLEPEMRKTLVTVAVAALLPFAVPAFAQQTSPEKKAQPAQVAPNAAEFDKQLAQMQEQMKQMQAQMEKIRATTDPQERQRLLQEHWTSMNSAMATMRGMWGSGGMGGPGMMGGPMMGWGHMRGYYANLSPEQMSQRQYMMDQYMPMQQMMLNQMMLRQQWMNPPPAPTK